mgnify:CR=1 FL=1|jgi:hypothetical protein
MVDQTLDEVRVVQEINKGKRHTELRKNYQDKITKHIESCSVQSLEKIVTLINKEENNYEHNET